MATSAVLYPPGHAALAYDANRDLSAYNGRIYYKIEQSARNIIGTTAIYSGEQAWKIDGQGPIAEFFNDDSLGSQNRMFANGWDGAGGKLAQASVGCPTTLSGCTFRWDSAENWYTGTGTPGGSQYDAWSLATHEFGHWVGLDHCAPEPAPSCPTPSTDISVPSMRWYHNPGDAQFRDISQDDANGFRRVRSPANVLANKGFEITSPYYGWKFLQAPGGTGAWARYCNTGLQHTGSCMVQFNGGGQAGASIYQDLVDTGYHGTDPWPDVSVWLRTDASTAQSVVLAVWNLDTNANVSRSCSVPGGGAWSKCTFVNAFNKSVNTENLRFQVYNQGTHNISVDDTQLH